MKRHYAASIQDDALDVLIEIEVSREQMLKTVAKTKPAPIRIGAGLNIRQILGLSAATKQKRQDTQAQKSNHRRLRNWRYRDILKRRSAEVVWMRGVIYDLEITSERAAINNSLLKIGERQDRTVDTIGRVNH